MSKINDAKHTTWGDSPPPDGSGVLPEHVEKFCPVHPDTCVVCSNVDHASCTSDTRRIPLNAITITYANGQVECLICGQVGIEAEEHDAGCMGYPPEGICHDCGADFRVAGTVKQRAFEDHRAAEHGACADCGHADGDHDRDDKGMCNVCSTCRGLTDIRAEVTSG